MSEAHPDMACKHVAAVVTEYLEGQLEAAERAQLEQHLLICQGCAELLAQNRLTIAGLELLAHPPLPAAARPRLMEAFRKLKGNAP